MAACVHLLARRDHSTGQLERLMAVNLEEELVSAGAAGVASEAGRAGDAADVLRRRLLRLSFDVHDGPMQDLIAMAQRMRLLRGRVAGASDLELRDAVVVELTDLVARVAETEGMLRSLMFELEHGSNADAETASIVAEHVEAFELHTDTSVDVSLSGDLELFTDSQRIALARVLRESLSNIARHANASNVTVSLHGTSERLQAEIEDDGRGFSPGTTASDSRRHIGLAAMRERLELLGGTLTVRSQLGKGTRITAVIEKWRPANSGGTNKPESPTMRRLKESKTTAR